VTMSFDTSRNGRLGWWQGNEGRWRR
jgi:hypothetical protein